MVKLDIIAGFLGAGKTTLINKLLAEVYTGEKPILIENEFGSVSIDDNLIEDPKVQVRVLASGCICCTLKGDFVHGVVKVEEFQPSCILIEPTGLANPADILTACDEVGKTAPLQVNAFVTVANAKTILPLLKISGKLFETQITGARLLLLNRTEKLEPEKLAETKKMIGRLNPDCILMDQDDIEANPLAIMTLAEEAVQRRRKDEQHSYGHDHEHDHGHDHEYYHDHEHGGVTGARDAASLSFFPEKVFSDEELKKLFVAFSSGDYGLIFRAKGFLKKEGGGFAHLEYVYGQGEQFDSAYSGEPKFVVIGVKLDKPALSRILLGL
jgi:G3E family GTPase